VAQHGSSDGRTRGYPATEMVLAWRWRRDCGKSSLTCRNACSTRKKLSSNHYPQTSSWFALARGNDHVQRSSQPAETLAGKLEPCLRCGATFKAERGDAPVVRDDRSLLASPAVLGGRTDQAGYPAEAMTPYLMCQLISCPLSCARRSPCGCRQQGQADRHPE
jgi:hypothetical protein